MDKHLIKLYKASFKGGEVVCWSAKCSELGFGRSSKEGRGRDNEFRSKWMINDAPLFALELLGFAEDPT